MELNEDPGPIDNYVLYDQNNHVSSAVWDGQVGAFSFPFIISGKSHFLIFILLVT
jgi:hypothetical protein